MKTFLETLKTGLDFSAITGLEKSHEELTESLGRACAFDADGVDELAWSEAYDEVNEWLRVKAFKIELRELLKKHGAAIEADYVQREGEWVEGECLEANIDGQVFFLCKGLRLDAEDLD